MPHRLAVEEIDDELEYQEMEDGRDLNAALQHALSMSLRRCKGVVEWLMRDYELLQYARDALAQHSERGYTKLGLRALRDLLAKVERVEREHLERLEVIGLYDDVRFFAPLFYRQGYFRREMALLKTDGTELADVPVRRGRSLRRTINSKRLIPGRRHWRRAREQRRAFDREAMFHEDLSFHDVDESAAIEAMIEADDRGAWEQYVEYCEWEYARELEEEEFRGTTAYFYETWYWDYVYLESELCPPDEEEEDDEWADPYRYRY